MDETPAAVGTAGPDVPQRAGLRANAIDLKDAVIVGMASSGPTASIALTLAAIVGVSIRRPVAILICGLPMFGIALAYRRLNRWQVDCGASYTWIGRAITPYLGFIVGWIMLLGYFLGMISISCRSARTSCPSSPPRTRTRSSQRPSSGAPGRDRHDHRLHRDQGHGAVPVGPGDRVHHGHRVRDLSPWSPCSAGTRSRPRSAGAGSPGRAWAGLSGLVGGILIAVYMFSGWDTSIYVNEETEKSRVNPGQAVLISVGTLTFMYVFFTFAYQGAVKKGRCSPTATTRWPTSCSSSSGHRGTR